MSKFQVQVNWPVDNEWVAGNERAKIVVGAETIRATELVATGLAGCLGMTFSGHLERMGYRVGAIDVQVEAIRADETPTVFTGFIVNITVRPGLAADVLQAALDQTKAACPVYATLCKCTEIEIKVNA